MEEMDATDVTDPIEARGIGMINVTPQFALAGEATFTVSNGTGKHHTYHIYRSKPSTAFPNPTFFIRMLVGADNKEMDNYRYMGRVVVPDPKSAAGTDPAIKMTTKSNWKEDAEGVKVARWALRAIWQASRMGYRMPPGYSIKHNGQCARCGAMLTHPASLDTGLGPECAAMVGAEWAERGAILV